MQFFAEGLQGNGEVKLTMGEGVPDVVHRSQDRERSSSRSMPPPLIRSTRRFAHTTFSSRNTQRYWVRMLRVLSLGLGKELRASLCHLFCSQRRNIFKQSSTFQFEIIGLLLNDSKSISDQNCNLFMASATACFLVFASSFSMTLLRGLNLREKYSVMR